MGSAGRREAWAVGAALVAHIALLVLGPRHAVSPNAVSLGAEAEDAIELDTEGPSKPADPPPTAPPPEAAPAAPEAPIAARAATPAPAKGPEPPAEANAKAAEPPAAKEIPGEPAPAAPAEPGPAAPPGPAPRAPAGDEYGGPAGSPGGSDVAAAPPGLGHPLWSIPGMIPSAAPPRPAPTVAEARPVDPNIAGQVLSGSLRKKDQSIGLGLPAAGAVATTLADAVRSAAPMDARATFEVKLGGDGSVEGVRVVSASAGDASTWARVVASARSTLGGRALQMSGDGRGATVIVKVESTVQFPAGSKTKIDAQPVCAEEVVEQIEAALKNGPSADLRRGPQNETGAPPLPPEGPDEDRKRKFCIPIGIRGKGDASNIGAHAVNVVKSTFQVTRAGEKALDADAVKPLDTRVPWAPEDPTKVRAPPPPKKKKKKRP